MDRPRTKRGGRQKFQVPVAPLWLGRRVPRRFWEDHVHRKQYVYWLGEQLGYTKPEDWYRVSSKDFMEHRGGGLLATYYDGSAVAAVREAFFDRTWHEWLFNKVPPGFWDQPGNCRRYLDWLGQQLGYRKWDDWYDVREEDFVRHKGATLIARYDSSPCTLLQKLVPEHDWLPWQFVQVPAGFWSVRRNRRRYMNWLGEQLGYKSLDDWHRVTERDFLQHHGTKLVKTCGSIYEALRDFAPHHRWQPWRMVKVPYDYWDDRKNRLEYLRWLRHRLGLRTWQDWYHVWREDFARNEGEAMLRLYYQRSPGLAVMNLLPRHRWEPWRFRRPLPGWWEDPMHRREYLEWLAKRLRIRSMEDWYRVGRTDFHQHFGHSLLEGRYGGSPYELLRDTFNEVEWLPWRFDHTPVQFWNAPEHRAWYFRWLGRELNLRTTGDWQRLSLADISRHCGRTLLRRIYGDSREPLRRDLVALGLL